jgi:hypothetical protein
MGVSACEHGEKHGRVGERSGKNFLSPPIKPSTQLVRLETTPINQLTEVAAGLYMLLGLIKFRRLWDDDKNIIN